MANYKISPDLFEEVQEINFFQDCIDKYGFRKHILQSTTSFGLIKNPRDVGFKNGRVEIDADTIYGQRAIKISEVHGIDNLANFIHLPTTTGIPVPADGNVYWVKIVHAESSIENGSFSIAANGDLTDTSGTAELTKLLRGMPNFPSCISFANSQHNQGEYHVLELIDDQNAIIQHTSDNASGMAQFVPEDSLQLKVVGTFTLGVAIPAANKYPFRYDSATITLELETMPNTPPAYVKDKEFYLARVQATDSTVIIQDMRGVFSQITDFNQFQTAANPLIGVESVRFNSNASCADKNIVTLAWGARSDDWSIDSTNNIVTFNSAKGGRYKSTADWIDGDLNGGRLYTPSGNYHRIIATTKVGGAISFQLETLTVSHFSPDGGLTLIPGMLLAVPDVGEVEIRFKPNPSDNVDGIEQTFIFPINQMFGRCDVLVYKDPCLYNVSYRYKQVKQYTEYTPLPSDVTNGYYPEVDFDTNGNLLLSGLVYQTYTSDAIGGFIALNMSPLAISKFRERIDKGDLIGTNVLTSLSGISEISLEVGEAKSNQVLKGDISLTDNVYFNISTEGAVNGSKFKFLINCTSLNLNGFGIFIVQNFGGSATATLKEIRQNDVYHMLNQENGIVIDCVYNGINWVARQNYNLGQPFQTTMFDGNLNDFFDPVTHIGNKPGYFGWKVSQVLKDGRTPVGAGTRTETYSNGNTVTKDFYIGDTGGEMNVQLMQSQNAKHHHAMWGSNPFGGSVNNDDFASPNVDLGGGSTYNIQQSTDQTAEPVKGKTGLAIEGGDQQHNNMQPYYVLAFLTRMY